MVQAEVGLGVRETQIDSSICAHAILQLGLFAVPDATKDEQFLGNPLVAGDPRLRFYAGALLETRRPAARHDMRTGLCASRAERQAARVSA
jgi:hypothetical protein